MFSVEWKAKGICHDRKTHTPFPPHSMNKVDGKHVSFGRREFALNIHGRKFQFSSMLLSFWSFNVLN